MTDAQGTKWESEIVNRAMDATQFGAGRYPKRGQKGEPDVWIGAPDKKGSIAWVVWKRLVGKRSGPERRKPDGERDTVTLTLDDALYLLELARMSDPTITVDIQAKWKSALNVTRTLGELRDWTKEHRT